MEDGALIDRLGDIVGGARVERDARALAPWLTDWRGRVTGDAIAMVSPGSTHEVQAIVRLAGEARVALTPQGGNTGMVAGGVPAPGGRAILLSLRRMNAIRAVDTADNSLVAEAGAILSDVHRAAEGVGRRFPLSLGAKDSATVGGLVAANAGGTQVLRFGTMRALTLGIEAVFPDGALFEGLASLRKDNRGYDLKQLLIGSEGTLGVITAATLKLVPAAPERVVAWAGLDAPDAALETLRALEAAAGDAVESFELVPHDALALVLRHIPATRAPLAGVHRWHILLEARGAADGGLAERVERALAACLARGLLADVAVAASEAQADAFWKLRDSIAEAERIDGASVKHDISVPVSAMPRFLIDGARVVEARFAGARILAFGHLGDGNIHFNVRAPEGSDAARWLADWDATVSGFVHDLIAAEGGSLSAEHGIGRLKRAEFARLADPARLAALAAIKHALDPQGVMNPGVLLT